MSKTNQASGPPIRGLMFDPARLSERHEFYFDILPDLSRWGINTILWHFLDDEGFMLKLDAHPDLASRYAFTKAKMRRFIRAAGEVGIDVIPEVEALGHARCITSRSEYAHLADGSEVGFNAACPSHPDTLKLYREIIEEVADLFDSPYLHAGLDEVDLSGCPRCARRGRGKPHWWVYAEHARALHEIVTRCGKRMIMWADHVERARGLLRRLPRDIVLMHWQYRQVHPERIEPSLKARFEVILAPALCHHGDMIGPNAGNLRNMDDMLALARRWRRRGVLGLINTFWTSVRGLRDAYVPAIAYTGWMLQRDRALDKPAFCHRYLRERFGITDRAAARALWRMYRTPLHHTEMDALLFDSPADMHAAIRLAEEPSYAGRLRALKSAAEILEQTAHKARDHKAEFTAIVSAAKIAQISLAGGGRLRTALGAYRRAEALYDRGASPETVREPLQELVKALDRIHGGMEEATDLAETQWNRTRHRNDPKKHTRRIETTPCKADRLLGKLARCRAAAASLLRRTRQGVESYERTGRFPRGCA